MPMAHDGRRAPTGAIAEVFALLPPALGDTSDEHRARRRRRVVHPLPPDRRRAARHARELRRRLRDAAAAGRRAPDVRSVRDRSRTDDASCGRRPASSRPRPSTSASRSCARRATRCTPRRIGADGRRRRLAARAGAVSRVAAQRVPRRAELPVVPHAGGQRIDARSPRCWASRARRLARHTFLGGNFFMLRMLNRYRSRARRDGAARRSSRRRRRPRCGSSRPTRRTSRSTRAARSGERARARRRRPQPDRAQAADRLSVAPCLAARDGARRSGRIGVRVRRGRSRAARSPATTTTRTRCAFEPHYDEIRTADQVQIYESVMADPAGRANDRACCRATPFVKDNRLLPRGFDKATAAPDIAVRGDAATDADFTASGRPRPLP